MGGKVEVITAKIGW